MKAVCMIALAAALVAAGNSATALAFGDAGGWHGQTSLESTATNRGDAVDISWSLAPDGIPVAVEPGWYEPANNLNSTLLSQYGPGYTEVIKNVFNRISQVSGLRIIQSADDGTRVAEALPGEWGKHGDIRVVGTDINIYGVGYAAFCILPYQWGCKSSMLTLNTTMNIWGGPQLANVVMHEAGHAIGFGHQTVYGTPTATSEYKDADGYWGSMTGFQNPKGPQFDDVYAMHRLYGDILERNGGNDTVEKATDMGDVTNRSAAKGTQIDDLTIAANETDFLSIDGLTDADCFKFHVKESSLLSLLLSPKGPNYAYAHEGVDWANRVIFDASEQSDLFFDLYDSFGSLIAHVNSTGLGESESLKMLVGTGDYVIKVAGLQDKNQMYRIDIAATSAVPEPSGLVALCAGILGAAPIVKSRRRR